MYADSETSNSNMRVQFDGTVKGTDNTEVVWQLQLLHRYLLKNSKRYVYYQNKQKVELRLDFFVLEYSTAKVLAYKFCTISHIDCVTLKMI